MADPVWLLLMFDLPVKTKKQRRDATRYRNYLLDLGFSMQQLSVYSRHCMNSNSARPIIEDLKATVPDEGKVRILHLTDKQWAGGWNLIGANYVEPDKPPEDLMLF